MAWVKGRQNTGYTKKTLLQCSFCDMHIIRYMPGQYIPPHVDVIEGHKHYRLNTLLKGDDSFECEKVIFRWWRVVLFRPDLSTHSVPRATRERRVLSIGFAIQS